jgi:hypothetical protein
MEPHKSGNNTLIFVLIIVVILYIIYSTTNNTDHFNSDTGNDNIYYQPREQYIQPKRNHLQEQYIQPKRDHLQEQHIQPKRDHIQPKRNYRQEVKEVRDNLSTISMSDVDDILGNFESRQDAPTDINKLYKHQLGPKYKDTNKMNNMYLNNVNKNGLSCLLNKCDGVYDTEDTFCAEGTFGDNSANENDKRRNTLNNYANFNDKINRNGVELTQVDKIAEIRSDPYNNNIGGYGEDIATIYDGLLSNTYTQKPQ